MKLDDSTEPTPENIRQALKLLSESGYQWSHEVLRRATERLVKRPLTVQQRKVFTYIAEYVTSRNMAPSYTDIAAHCGYKSLATVNGHVNQLERKGWIKRDYHGRRSISIQP